MVVQTSPLSFPIASSRRVPRAALRLAIAFISVTAIAAAADPGIARAASKSTTKTTKASTTSARSKVAAGSTVSTVKATTTTLPKPISAGKPLKGWESISDTEWPVTGDAVIASATGKSVEIFRTPGDRTDVLRLDNGKSVFGSLHLLALGMRDDYVRVAIPIRPNGTVGWVKRSEVTLKRSQQRLVIELATNTLTVTDGDAVVAQVPVAAGTGGTPTPTGLFFLKELVPQANPNGALGPYAFGLSGFSTVLMTFAGGQGVIGIHGTNAPGKLGGDVSHGCVRVDNATIRRLVGALSLGTPVEIVKRLDQLPPKAFRVSSDWMLRSATASPVNTGSNSVDAGSPSTTTTAGATTTTAPGGATTTMSDPTATITTTTTTATITTGATSTSTPILSGVPTTTSG